VTVIQNEGQELCEAMWRAAGALRLPLRSVVPRDDGRVGGGPVPSTDDWTAVVVAGIVTLNLLGGHGV
jgi:hypothetical protein